VPPPGLQTPITAKLAAPSGGATTPAASAPAIREQMSLVHLVRAYQVRGHEVAVLDPLSLRNRQLTSVPELDYRTYGFTEADLDRVFDLTAVSNVKGFLSLPAGAPLTLRVLLAALQNTYCGTVGWEYMHITSREKCNWIRERVEMVAPAPFTKTKKLQVLDRLMWADRFERFLAQKFNTAKRFGATRAVRGDAVEPAALRATAPPPPPVQAWKAPSRWCPA